MTMEKKEEKGYWIIPSHFKDWRKQNNLNSEPTRYWLIEYTLTSGETHTFYVKSKTQEDALEKAKDYEFLVEDEKFRNGGFRLRH
jgi:hypothetical protein